MQVPPKKVIYTNNNYIDFELIYIYYKWLTVCKSLRNQISVMNDARIK